MPRAPERTLAVGLGLLWSRSGAVEGTVVSAGALRVEQHVQGLTLAGFGSSVGGTVQGASLAGAATHVGGDLEGAELVGLGSWVEGSVSGTALAGGALWIGRDFTGFAAAGGLVRHGGTLRGAEVAPLSLGGTVQGAQIGVGNLSGDVEGAQIGVVNVGGRVRGAQIGVVNVARDVEGASVGLVNIVKSARTQLLLTIDSHEAAMVSVRTRTPTLYTEVGIGQPAADLGKGRAIEYAIAVGAAFDVSKRITVGADLQYAPRQDVVSSTAAHRGRQRVFFSFQVFDAAGIYLAMGLENRLDVDQSNDGWSCVGVQFF